MLNTLSRSLNKEEQLQISAIFNENYYRVIYFKGVPYVSSLIFGIIEKIGIIDFLSSKARSVEEVMQKFSFVEQTKLPFEWLLRFLHNNSFLELDNSKSINKYFYNKKVAIDSKIYYEEIVKLDKNIIPSCRLMEYVATEYPKFLRGEKTGFDIIFAKNKMNLWLEYFSNDNSGYAVYNSFGAFEACRWFPLNKEAIRIIEIGGGTGNAAALLLKKIIEKGYDIRLAEYIFTDISPIFLRIGNKLMMEKIPEFDFDKILLKKLDFNKSFVEQKFCENDIDIVYGVNALHVATDLLSSLKHIIEIIKPGGKLIISESVRENNDDLLVQEIIFNMLDDFLNVKTDPRLRPTLGFITASQWGKLFTEAGFKNIEIITNSDIELTQEKCRSIPKLAAVIKGEKS